MIKLYNTLTRTKETFNPIKSGVVSIYSCGPTVYARQHIGNMRSVIFSDILKRALRYNQYKINDVINITDVGHLATDEGDGEDKLAKAAEKEGKNPYEIAKHYEDLYVKDMKELNVIMPKYLPRATEHINEQIDFIKELEEAGLTYKTSDGVYFDTLKFKDYGKLSGQNLDDKKAGARVEIKTEKKNTSDFALWKFLVDEHKNHAMKWDSPWGVGFPGWHIECSAMSLKYLGNEFDIHVGGVDHIPIHHENEIAQNTGSGLIKKINFWIHHEHLLLDNGKMSKSLGNVITLDTLKEKGVSPIAFRYWLLTANYKTAINFTWDAVGGAKIALDKLYDHTIKFGKKTGNISKKYKSKFTEYINDNLDTPKAIALMWKLIKDDTVSPANKYATILDFDKVFGLNIAKQKIEETPSSVKKLLEAREEFRKKKEWDEADKIRKKINKLGYEIEDNDIGVQIHKTVSH